MATTKILLATGDEVEVSATLDEVVKTLENSARSSAGTLARMTDAAGGGSLALNAAHVVLARDGDDEH
jgi:hypothetical protein